MLNNNIVPGQCAEYIASAVLPYNPNPTEYNKQVNAIITGYHFKIDSFITVILFFLLSYAFTEGNPE